MIMKNKEKMPDELIQWIQSMALHCDIAVAMLLDELLKQEIQCGSSKHSMKNLRYCTHC